MPGSGGWLRQKKTHRVLKVSHKFLNFWGKIIWENYGKRAKSKRKRGYKINETTYAKGGCTLNAYMCAQGAVWEGSKNWPKDPHVLNAWHWINVTEYCLCTGSPNYPRPSLTRKMPLFPSIIMPDVRLIYPM